ncbi:1-deoxy-D-xylulose-5-phosphate synthase [Azorhizobium oxalatiphilum]|uniref:1-deoxy-D-xylulose-5-phosphate synthase n=1 Tax=Azorhizobium oxalatiphilum TaxID=980631 RepID=A0A917BW04_9HYPH|nr:transketolase [Azorhizobium oxalatiphilum]GGF58942.1 1-deoxy-D-xylulose-5-phosphate synthase [Azorhizobium oxalatiphilum]
MRQQLCDALVLRSSRPDMVFLTGDLGFMALVPLQEAMGERFINAGVAEQNMISVVAALAREGMEAWAYSIAPFCYARPFEQVRNDIAFHNLPVKLIGNGGGYGYGVMGPTHHAIEDYGILLALPHMRAFVPAFDEDLKATIDRAGEASTPCYIRLGRGEVPAGYETPAYAPWRQLVQGGGMAVVAVGPVAGTYIEAFRALPEPLRPNFWVVSELPLDLNPMPADLLAHIRAGDGLCVIEEHVRRGGLGSEIALLMATQGISPKRFAHVHARAHHYATYGSQAFLRAQSGLDVDSVLAVVAEQQSEIT